MLSAEIILTIATSGLFIQYLYYHFYEKSFKESYKKFKEKFDAQLRKEIGEDLKKLVNKIKGADFETLSNTLKNEAYKLQEVSQPASKYLEIHDRVKYFYIAIFVSIFCSIFSLRMNNYTILDITLLDWAFYALVGALILFVWIFLDIHKLKKQVIKFELGDPIKELLKEKFK